MARKYQNFLSGTLSVAHAATETLLSSPGFVSLGAISAPDYVTVVINPEGDATFSGGPEVVHVTSHASNASSAQVIRGQQGTIARDHAVNTPWVAAVTADDWLRVDALSAQVGAILADNWVTPNRIAAGAIGRYKISEDLLAANSGIVLIDGQLAAAVDGLTIENAVGGMRLKDSSITAAKLALASVTNDKLENLAVTTGKIADNAVTPAKLGIERSVYTINGAMAQNMNGVFAAITEGATNEIGFAPPSANKITVPTGKGGWYLIVLDFQCNFLTTVPDGRDSCYIETGAGRAAARLSPTGNPFNGSLSYEGSAAWLGFVFENNQIFAAARTSVAVNSSSGHLTLVRLTD